MSDPKQKIVEIGSKVTIKIGGKTRVLTIVTSQQVKTEIGAISFESPIGKSLIGARIGDIVSYKNPIGQTIFVEVKEIE